MVHDELPLPQKLAVAHSAAADRRIIEPFFVLDNRLAQFVSQSKEPVLTQMRIAWWRDQLGKPVEQRPEGDPVLDALSAHWARQESALVALVDGWEALLAEPPLPDTAAQEFTEGRAKCFAAIAHLCDLPSAKAQAYSVGTVWAYADLLSRMSDQDEKQFVLSQCQTAEVRNQRLPYQLRSLSILGILAENAISKGGGPLIQGRRDFLTVTRVGLFGR
ncbi:hypothetical protein HKD42_05225 [Altererythrobacter sp. RZ02]|uniref:Phytoene synthase n=1 Tax=Pontixanthobacter rizhaonensis TaxID=2730337 RepID=A0A848QK38_9SPHN|nr:hypothetical protein [Pontixanthobacter rizhaonensis]NMW31454.1 hypothetical protein [Pontixanthobacter rizhaonensis]